ncbi:hypothetical protein CBW53_02895 [Yersinia frederiksenii]|nr:hypothetical protein CBW53_02895 [Yersinia frederiksenii]CNI68537.1 Uncharacterised protein [Yersinia frederiksenii]
MKNAEKEYVEKIISLGCIACYIDSGLLETPAEAHHERDGMGMGQRSSWFRIIGLCPDHHRNGMNGKIAIHKDRRAFIKKYGTEDELIVKVRELAGITI